MGGNVSKFQTVKLFRFENRQYHFLCIKFAGDLLIIRLHIIVYATLSRFPKELLIHLSDKIFPTFEGTV